MNPERAGTKPLFYDTYALVAIAGGQPNYRGYEACVEAITTIMNLYELYYILLRDHLPDLAEHFLGRLSPHCVPVGLHHIRAASQFRLLHHGISYIDALGYVISQQFGAFFLTGDEAFRRLPGVRFVK